MRHAQLFVLAVALGAGAVTASACATRQAPYATKTATLAPKASAEPQRIGSAELWASHCSRCHNLRARTEYSPSQWAVIVNHMRTVADLPGNDYRQLLEYLADRTPSMQRTGSKVVAGTQAGSASSSKRSP